MRFKCTRDCTIDGVKVKANVTVVETQADLTVYREGWYRIPDEPSAPPVKPRVNKAKK